LAGGNPGQALAGLAAPYVATEIKERFKTDTARITAHAVAGAMLSHLQGHSALAGGAGALSAEVAAKGISQYLYPGIELGQLTETQKETVSAWSTLVGGLAGGLTGTGGGDVVAGAQAGKNAVNNNFLSTPSATKRDELADKIIQGDMTLQTAKEYLQLENADKRSDALVAQFKKDPTAMTSDERNELNSYLRIYAAEMQTLHGDTVTRELITGMLTGQDYLKSAPKNEAQQKAQTIMNTWGYHTSNASMGDPILAYGLGPLGNSIKTGMATNAAIGVGVNTAVQLNGKDPFSYVDAVMAGVTAASSTGKSLKQSAVINMAGAALGSAAKGEEPTNAVLGAGLGSFVGSKVTKGVTDKAAGMVKESTADLMGAVVGSYLSEKVSSGVKTTLDLESENETK
ncbi:VENN motif pre-toxin domain-containing protein, partial [Sodalis sp. dw_96]|uniref:VENN motif pre-toxin domain-containing protein n=1 Tax=Sodalis sp. dw_96 TaxID=2719794 RepID=UPI002103C831